MTDAQGHDDASRRKAAARIKGCNAGVICFEALTGESYMCMANGVALEHFVFQPDGSNANAATAFDCMQVAGRAKFGWAPSSSASNTSSRVAEPRPCVSRASLSLLCGQALQEAHATQCSLYHMLYYE